MPFQRHCIASRRILGVALLALLLGHWTVLVHSIAHAHAHAPASSTGDVESDHAWGHEAGTAICLWVDHLLAEQAPAGEPPPALCPLPGASQWAPPPSTRAPRATLRAYDARGPPRT